MLFNIYHTPRIEANVTPPNKFSYIGLKLEQLLSINTTNQQKTHEYIAFDERRESRRRKTTSLPYRFLTLLYQKGKNTGNKDTKYTNLLANK